MKEISLDEKLLGIISIYSERLTRSYADIAKSNLVVEIFLFHMRITYTRISLRINAAYSFSLLLIV